MWPVILRELRVGSRRWTTYWLRLLAAGAVMLAVLWWLVFQARITNSGHEVFAWSHRVVLAAIWILVPLMTCDCLSSEKREGTLGLLFLTQLDARQIVMAKAVAHGLRALTLWLATVPLIAVPILLGGLSWLEILLSCALCLCSILFALGLGLWASAVSRRLNTAVALSMLLMPLAFLGLAVLFTTSTMTAASWVKAQQWNSGDFFHGLDEMVGFIWNADDDWNNVVTLRGVQPVLLVGTLICAVTSLLSLIATVLLAAGLVRRNWQDKPKTKRQTEVERFFCTPSFFPNIFRRWMRHSLERNPIGWLEKRSWTGRMTSWIWFALMISFGTMLAYAGTDRGLIDFFNGLMWLLLVSIAYVAAGSFRRERETGALELILVTPLSERQVIHGRLRGLWSQFLPTFVLWTAMVLYLSSGFGRWHIDDLLTFGVAFLVVPVVGLYFSLRCRFVLLAWVLTLAVCFVLPQVLWKVFYVATLIFFSFADRGYFARQFMSSEAFILIPLQLGVAALLLRRLRVNLAQRSFSLR